MYSGIVEREREGRGRVEDKGRYRKNVLFNQNADGEETGCMNSKAGSN